MENKQTGDAKIPQLPHKLGHANKRISLCCNVHVTQRPSSSQSIESRGDQEETPEGTERIGPVPEEPSLLH